MSNCRRLSVPLALALCWSASPSAVELDQLWVPKSYLRHLPRLHDAATKVENWSRCAEFIEGTTHLDRTTEEQAVFTLTCRDAEGQTFNVLVDGPTLHKVDEARPDGLVSFEQLEQERREAAEREREREKKQQELAELERRAREAEGEERAWQDWWQAEHERRRARWAECVEALEQRVSGMQALEWLTTTMPEPKMQTEPELESHPPLTFTIDFDAESYYGEPLFYRALCHAEEGEVSLEIGTRPGARE